MTLYPSLIETLSNELSNDNTNKQYIKISNNMEIPEIVEPKSVVITNPEKISYSIDLKGKSYIAKLCIWTEVEFNGEKEMMWKVYYFQKAFKSIADLRNPHQLVKSYFGSSKGKNTTQDEILQDMKTTTKNPKIVILDLLETADAAFEEQKHITLHNFPHGGGHIESVDCYNKNNGVGRGTIPHRRMLSHIQYEEISEDHVKHKNGEPQYPEGERTKEQCKKIIKEERYVQSRQFVEGNVGSIEYYAERMRANPHKPWRGKLTVFMPEDGNPDNDELLDGNQSMRAMFRVGNMKKLNTIEIPYEKHCYLIEEDKEALGNELNKPDEFRKDDTAEGDAVKNCKKIIENNNLYTKAGLPNFKHPLIKNKLHKLNFSDSEIKSAISETKSYFKQKAKNKKKELEGYYDYSDKALSANEDDQGNPIPNNNLKQYKITVRKIIKEINDERIKNGEKPINFRFGKTTYTGNIYKISYGMYGSEKIANWFYQHQKNGTKIPECVLILVTFEFEEDWKEFLELTKKNNNKTFLETGLFNGFWKLVMGNDNVKEYEKLLSEYTGPKNIIIKALPMTKK